MLLSPHIKLIAAFNHSHIFLDPAPDPATAIQTGKTMPAPKPSSPSPKTKTPPKPDAKTKPAGRPIRKKAVSGSSILYLIALVLGFGLVGVALVGCFGGFGRLCRLGGFGWLRCLCRLGGRRRLGRWGWTGRWRRQGGDRPVRHRAQSEDGGHGQKQHVAFDVGQLTGPPFRQNTPGISTQHGADRFTLRAPVEPSLKRT